MGWQFLALELQRIRPGRDKILDHLVSILLIECVRDYIDALQDSNNWLSALSHPELSNALAKIHAEPAQPLTVESLCRTVLYVTVLNLPHCLAKFSALALWLISATTPSAFSRPIPA